VNDLKHNLLSISQLCDNGYYVNFTSNSCNVLDKNKNNILVANRFGNVYITCFENLTSQDVTCFSALQEANWLWHRRLGHVNMDLLQKLSRNNLVVGLPKANFSKDKICDACQFGKQIKTSFKTKAHISTSRPLELLHLDLFGPNDVESLGGKLYAFVIVDDYSRYTWVLFLAHKSDASGEFIKLCKRIEKE
ncbi:hypothetical protein, partial [Modestobacter marinus]|uniref:hypothetical protein n=1 Tax=Modestobacter marinus TaxID=477641 RepID=UPI001C973561